MGAKQQGATATDGRWLVIPRTLCFIFNGEDVLLMKRAAHKRIFPNQYNGVGGHIEHDEDPFTGAKREIMEETGLDVEDLTLRSIHNINTDDSTGIMLFVFTAISQNRDFKSETDEGTLHWIPLDKLEDYDLVEDLPLILPRLAKSLDDSAVMFAHISYDENDTIQIVFAAH